MKDLEDFLPFVMPWCRGASDLAAINAVRRAAQEFCTRATVWRVRIIDVPIGANNPLIDIPIPEGALLQELRYVDYMSGAVDPDTPENRRAHCVDDDSVGPVPRLWGTEIDVDGNVRLRILPKVPVDIPAALRIRAYLQPSDTATQLPDFMLTRFGQAIGNGAAKYLHSTKEDWADPKRAGTFADLFAVDIVAAEHWAQTNSMRDSRYTTPAWR